jgi:hypothetical protein
MGFFFTGSPAGTVAADDKDFAGEDILISILAAPEN